MEKSMAISDLSDLDKAIINPATCILHFHTKGLRKNQILCQIDAWFYGIPDELFAEAVQNGEIEHVGEEIYKITKKGKQIVEANQYPVDENWPPPPPVWD